MDANFHRLEIGVQAIQLSPYHAGPSAHRPWQLSPVADSLACSGPQHLSDPGEPSGPGISLQFLPAEPGIQQGASWRTCIVRRCCAACTPRHRSRVGDCPGCPVAVGGRSGRTAAGRPRGCPAPEVVANGTGGVRAVGQDNQGPGAWSAHTASGHADARHHRLEGGCVPAWPAVKAKARGRARRVPGHQARPGSGLPSACAGGRGSPSCRLRSAFIVTPGPVFLSRTRSL